MYFSLERKQYLVCEALLGFGMVCTCERKEWKTNTCKLKPVSILVWCFISQTLYILHVSVCTRRSWDHALE